ncbi:MAG TPA: baseplate J/gp47 family protein [Roseiflexaceae bacterium]|nr:baseplate J/gp47 family protein [Roseiflexaceae bacterium]
MAFGENLIDRPYTEIVDDVLVALVGGVVNEQQTFDVREAVYPLAEPARDVRGVTGTARSGATGELEHRTFLPNVDWAFDRAQNALVWLENGARPAEEDPVFYVDYFRRDGSPSPLTDINVGSVTRTLAEAMSREIAVLYNQVNLAYQSGFIDLARGRALDFVVAILGVARKDGDFAQGLVSFFRAPTARGNITIPQGTKLTTADNIIFETTAERTLQRGQTRIDVPVRAAAGFKGPAGRVDARAITQTIFPIEGIERVVNFDPLALGGADETDEELRVRAKAALRALGQCTLDALLLAAIEGGADNVEVADPMFPPDPEGAGRRTDPGRVVMVVEVEPERYANVVSSVFARRAAGISVEIVARYIFIRPRLSIALRRDLTAAGKEQLKQDVITALHAFAATVGSGNPVPGAGLLAAIGAVPDVQAAVIADLLVWRAVVDDPSRAGQREAARELIVGADGSAPATDEQIETGAFAIQVAPKYWPVIEIEPADIQLTGP